MKIAQHFSAGKAMIPFLSPWNGRLNPKRTLHKYALVQPSASRTCLDTWYFPSTEVLGY